MSIFSLPIAILLSCSVIQAQKSLLTRPVTSLQVRPLAHHHPQWANESNSIGLVSPNQTISQLTMVLARSPQQEAAFEQLLADQQNPGSPQYHHWLTPIEIGERFGLAAQDIDNITGWLQSQGLNVGWISPSKTFIGFSGKAADINRAFQTELRNYRVNNTDRISVTSDPMIPVALAPAVKSIQGLYTVEDRPAHHMEALETSSPNATFGSGTHYISPADFATIYNLPSNLNGTGYTIGIVGRARTNMDDFRNFMSKTNTNFNLPTEVVPTTYGGVDPGPALTTQSASGNIVDQEEATLDVLRAGSVAPGANILLVVATNASGGIGADVQYLVNTSPLPAQIINISFGECESAAGSVNVGFWDSLFKQAAGEGISVFVSSGDSGASGCDTSFETPPANPNPNSPNYICSSSYVTCVGGTEFADTSSPSSYWDSNNSTGLSSALRYIPEGGWNDPLHSNSPVVASSGGGVSSYIATPSWQTGTGVPTARAGRYTPDVSFSGANHDSYFGCFAAGGGGCVTQAGTFYFTLFSGTSASAPDMAGITALLDQKKGSALGNLNPALYSTAASSPSIFHDVTVATSGVTNCSVNTPSMCNNSAPSPTGLTGGQAGYLVTDGYDLVTGLGSFDVNAFINGVSVKATPSITISPSATSIALTDTLSLKINVSNGSGNPVPTGSVAASDGTYTSAATTLSGGSATISIPGSSLTVGNHTFTVTYTPDTTSSTAYNTATSTTSVSVTQNPVNPTITETLSASTISTTQSLTVTVTVAGGTGLPTPTGSVDFGSFASASAVQLSSGKAILTIPAGTLTAGTYSIPANYTPDTASAVYYNKVSTSASLTVSAAVPASFALSGTATSVSAGSATSNTSTITLTPSGGFTGSVTLTAAVTSSPSGAQHVPTVAFTSGNPATISGTNPVTATMTISTTAPTTSAQLASSAPALRWYAAGSATLACVLIFIPGRRRWKTTLGVMAFLIVITGSMVACGGGSKGSTTGGGSGGTTTDPGTTKGAYVITVTGTSGSTTATTVVNLTVQ